MGPAVAQVAARLGLPLMPWQQQVVDVALELDPDGSFHYDELNLTVPRQSGKTTLILALIVHRLVVMARTLGPQRVTYTAQLRAKARLKLERDFSDTLRKAKPNFREVTHIRQRPSVPHEWKLSLNNGAENILFGLGNYLQIDAPSRTGGHGDTLDLGVIDEAFAHQDDTIESGMSPSMITRQNRLLTVLSTAGDAQSKYLFRKVTAGRSACEAFEAGNLQAHGRTAYFEWSAPDDAEPGDPDVWAGCSPALGYTITLRALEGEWEKAQRGGQEGVDKFRRAYLNQWPEVPVLTDDIQYRVIPAPSWLECERIGHKATGALRYALDIDTNAAGAEWCSIGCSDGSHLELVTPPDTGAGTEWVVPAVVAKRSVVGELLIAGGSPAKKLVDPLVKAGIRVKVVTPDEFTQASMQMLDAVVTNQVRHIDQLRLNKAVAGVARRDVGDGAWRFSRKLSPVDVSPLVAVTLAKWAAGTDTYTGPLVAVT